MSDTRERCVHGRVDPLEWCTSCMAARIAELEAQVREQGEALKVAGDALRWLVNVVCGVGESGDYPSISEDGAAVDAAKSALAHPLIGGAK